MVPYLLGFHPQESIVLLVMAGSRTVLTARWDIPPAEFSGEVPGQVAALLARNPAYEAGLIVYAAERDAGMAVARDLERSCGRVPVFSVVTDGARWWQSWDDGGPGEPVSPEVPPIVAAAVVSGLSAVGQRSELGAALEPQRDASPEVVAERERVRARLRRRRVAERELLLTEVRLLGPASDPDALVQAGLLVGTDRLWLLAWRGIRRSGAAYQRDFWQAVLKVTLPAHAAPVLSLIGIAAWLQGEGVVTSLCLERAQALDPKACGIGFLELLITTAISPAEYEPIFAHLLDPDGPR